jgi:hypothetical protein
MYSSTSRALETFDPRLTPGRDPVARSHRIVGDQLQDLRAMLVSETDRE